MIACHSSGRPRGLARACAISLLALFVLGVAAPAGAQFRPAAGDLATGERYHIEAAAGYWFPTADISVSSQSLGIAGTTIDFKRDLGITDQHFPEFRLELRAARRHKFRFQYIPINYTQSSVLTRDVIFNGQRYRVGLPVNSMLDWKAYRVGYEYDFVATDRIFAGFILDVKYTDVSVSLASPLVTDFATARAPIPALGGVVRGYIMPNISVTGEFSGMTLPEKLIKDNTGHYFDLDIYGTLNFTNNIGVQLGYRRFDVGYDLNDSIQSSCPNATGVNAGCFKLQGMFFGVVARY
jgi:hypothetical protein